MAKNRRIKVGRKLLKLFKWYIRRRTHQKHLEPSSPISKLRRWVHSFTLEARSLCRDEPNPVGIELSRNPIMPPKGHLAVYVGEEEESISRVVVPVLYFNHPLFGSLLRETEKVYGFDQPGGIQIPCPVSELDAVRMKIAAAIDGGRKLWDRGESFCEIASSFHGN